MQDERLLKEVRKLTGTTPSTSPEKTRIDSLYFSSSLYLGSIEVSRSFLQHSRLADITNVGPLAHCLCPYTERLDASMARHQATERMSVKNSRSAEDVLSAS